MVQETERRVVAGRYEIAGELGRGGMGVVWRARDLRLQRDVAIKEVDLPDALGDDDARGVQQRACREAQAAARLNHAAVVTVFDVLEENGRACIVMELVDAPSLSELVEHHGPLTPQEAADVGLQVLGALDSAHRAGIVHRDVKPGNVMVTDRGEAKLADFGIASVKDDTRITATGLVLGSPAFMAPEQGRGEPSSPKTDLWSLGATLYYAVEGRPPFDKGHAIATLGAVIDEDPRPPKAAGSLAPVIEALLTKDPDHRPNAEATRQMLREVASGRALTEAAPSTVTSAEDLEEEAYDTHDEEPRRRPLLALVALLGVLFAAAAGAYLLVGAGNNDPEGRRATTARGPGGERDERAENSRAGDTDPAAEETAPDGDADEDVAVGSVPSDWVEYRDATTGYTLAYPPEWTVETGSATANSTDFQDPDTGAFLRVDWKQPPGPSAVGAWEDYEPAFAADHAGYERIGEIEATTYQGYEAARWEFTFEAGETTMHAVDLGFIVGDDYGFALYFSAPEDSWDDVQDEFEAFQASFQAPQ